MDLSLINYIGMFLIAGVVFSIVDVIWLGTIAKDLYRKELKSHLAKDFNMPYAVAFYVTYLVGLLFFVVVPAVNEDSLGIAMGRGLLFGFFNYATYELTNAATMKKWSNKIVVVDLLWGSFLTFVVATATYSIYTGLAS